MPRRARSEQSLDALLHDEPHGTFHDAVLLGVQVDYVARRFVALFEICVGDPNAEDEATRERRRRGRLVIEGLKLWALEPPGQFRPDSKGPLWLTAEGPVAESPTETGKGLARTIGNGGTSWFLYFGDINAFGYVAGDRIRFAWV